MKFLIVDDSKAMRNIVFKSMQKAGYKDHLFEFAENGQQALELIKNWEPDLVLSDWHMPILDGMGLLNAIREQQLDIRIGLITTERSEERIKEALDAGALFLVSKPFTPDQLNAAIFDALSIPDDSEEEHLTGVIQAEQEQLQEIFDEQFKSKIFLYSGKIHNEFNYPFIVGTYCDDANQIDGICILDNAASCYLGSALTEIPSNYAYEAISNEVISREIYDNASDLLHSLSSAFYDSSTLKELKFKSSNLVNNQVEKLLAALDSKAMLRNDYLVETPGYGIGRMIILSKS